MDQLRTSAEQEAFCCTADQLIGPFLDAMAEGAPDPRMAVFEPVTDPDLRRAIEKALHGIDDDAPPEPERGIRRIVGMFHLGSRKPEDRA